MIDRRGQLLGNYRLIRLLGEGGFAEVYLGEHVHLGTLAAIKVAHTQLTGDDMEHFRTEARMVAHLEHPHIVRILDSGVEGKIPFIVMSYAPNGTLRQRHCKGTVLPLSTIVSYIRQVADALQYAHDEKVIHRDIKPENMLLGRNNEILLSDFGIAIVTQSSRYQSTQDVIGTAAYMAPEQIQGKPRPASDQYSLGIVVYEWLSGDRPFHGSFTELCAQHIFASLPPLHEKLQSVSSAVEEVVMTALAKDPKSRFTSVQAFATALEQASLSVQLASTIPDQSLQLSVIEIPPTQYAPPIETLSSRQPLPDNMSHLPIESQITKRGTSRRVVVMGLVALAVTTGTSSITWLVLSQKSQVLPTSSSSNRIFHTSPTSTSAHPTPTSSPHSLPIGTTLLTYQGHSDWLASAAWSPDDGRIASSGNDQTVQVWDASNGSTIFTYHGHSAGVNAAAWSYNGKRIGSGSNDTTVQVWDAFNGNNVLTYRGHTDIVRAVAWSPDGTRIASASGDRTAQVWDGATGRNITIYRGHSDGLDAVAWSPNGQQVASSSNDHTVQIWNAASGSTIFTYRGHFVEVNALGWSHSGTRIVSGDNSASVQVWQAS